MAEKEADQSKKTEVIKNLFDRLWPEDRSRPKDPMIVTSDQVVEGINERNRLHKGEKKGLSSKNPANFLKDFIRKRTCNDNWPKRLWDKKISARQRYGEGQVFEFVDWRADDTKPFEDRFDPVPGIPQLDIESLSIPSEARALGRGDEPWLTQVIVSQRVINTHLAVVAREQGLRVEQLAHLQMSVKTQPEIDATFIATIRQTDSKGKEEEIRAYLTGEAKQLNERILEDQIREQVAKAFELTEILEGKDRIDAVMPMAFQVIHYPLSESTEKSPRGIYVVQFHPILRTDFTSSYMGDKLHKLPLKLQSHAFYRLHPPVLGISLKKQKVPKISKSSKGSE